MISILSFVVVSALSGGVYVDVVPKAPSLEASCTDSEVANVHKKSDEKRVYYKEGPVAEFYTSQHARLTYAIADSRKKSWIAAPKQTMSIRDMLILADDVIDPSDPDISLGQIHHAFQTANSCRQMVEENPTLPDWLPLIGLLHDLGKVTCKTHNISWDELSGDSYPLGCPWDDNVVLRDLGFEQNPDTTDAKYNTGYGLYSPGIGFDDMTFWGHDEIIYQILNQSPTNLPREALYVARYHSFYAWHSQNGYAKFANAKDRVNLGILRAHQRADLYSKTDLEHFTIEAFDDSYYQNLIDKYIPGGTLLV